jgi:outer membrane beta-barrel protein
MMSKTERTPVRQKGETLSKAIWGAGGGLWAVAAGIFIVPVPDAAADSRFSAYEIRVIRPRNFVKSGTLELSGGLMNLSNQSFVYSMLGVAGVGWHFDEKWALEMQGAYGSSFDKSDKRLLSERFNINTVVLRTESLLNGRISFTPAYGKVNLPDGDIVYFDTYFSAGAGSTAVRYTYDHCDKPSDYPAAVAARIPDPPSERTVSYTTGILGAGQRWFTGEESSIKVGIDFQRFLYAPADGACVPDQAEDGQRFHDNVFLFAAWSRYF